jgi:hypothetical protein
MASTAMTFHVQPDQMYATCRERWTPQLTHATLPVSSRPRLWQRSLLNKKTPVSHCVCVCLCLCVYVCLCVYLCVYLFDYVCSHLRHRPAAEGPCAKILFFETYV